MSERVVLELIVGVIDAGGAVRLYKSSTQLLGRSTPALTLGSDNADEESGASLSARASWEEEVLPAKGECGFGIGYGL